MKGMNGHIIDGTSICVDYWLWTPEKKYVHFLTHLHADHTVGLKSSFRERIYTSPFNAWLVERWFKIDPELIVSLTVGDSHIIYNESAENHFSVTLIDANHCPGSTMFLFQGSFGNILYTGDFRYNPDMLEHPMMKSVIENEVVHKLYIDNTFAAEHCEFPSRNEALKDLITLISNHQEHYIILGARKLGKEDAFKSVALHLKENILVSEERLKILAYLKYPNVFTTNGKEARIRVKEIHQITTSFLHKLQEEKGPILTVLLTALYNINPANGRSVSKLPSKMPGVYHIPYSDHCSHSELLTFVSKVRPHSIYPIVLTKMTKILNNEEGSDNDLNYCYHLKHLSESCIIPTSILSLCRQPEAIVYEMSIIKDKIKPVNTEDLSQQTEDKSRFTELSKSDQMECEVYSSLKSSNYSDDLESQSFVSFTQDCIILPGCYPLDGVVSSNNVNDTTANSGGDDFYSMPDEGMNQENAASNITFAHAKLGSDGELLNIINKGNFVDKLEHSKTNTYLCNQILPSESGAFIQLQGFSCIDEASEYNTSECTNLNEINVKYSNKIEDHSPSTESNRLIRNHMQGSPSSLSIDVERKIDSLTNISQINVTYVDEENPSSTLKDSEMFSPSLISSSNQAVNENSTVDKSKISKVSTFSCNQIWPNPIFGSEASMRLQGMASIDTTSECNKSSLHKVNDIDVHSMNIGEEHSQSTEPSSLTRDHFEDSPSSVSKSLVRKIDSFTNISQINFTYSDEESPSSTVKDNEILSSPSLISFNNKMKEKNSSAYELNTLREEHPPTSVIRPNNLSSLTFVNKWKSLDNPVSTEMSIIVDSTEENTIPERHNVNNCDESIKPVSEYGAKPNCTLNKQCNYELDGTPISITKNLLFSDKSVKNYQSLKTKNHLLPNELQVDSSSCCGELLPVTSQLHSKFSSPIKNSQFILHTLDYVDTNNTDKQETEKYSQRVIKLDPFYNQIQNLYKSWQKSVKKAQFKHHKLKNATENNHREMWKDYDWKSLFKNEKKYSSIGQ